MRVSVIIPLYNKASYIVRALSSVLRQTVRDLECIVVDDGSTDGGGDLVENLKDPRVRLVRQINGGVSRARNQGVSLARHPLIAFLDADDEWRPGFLEAGLEMHREHPGLAASFTNYQRAPEGGPVLRQPKPRTRLLKDYFAFCLYNGGLGMCSSTVMARRGTLQKIGGFPEGRTMGEDLDTWFRLACAGAVAYTPTPLAIYHNSRKTMTALPTNPDVWPTCLAYANSNGIPKAIACHAEQWAALTRLCTVKDKLRSHDAQASRDLLSALPSRLLLNAAGLEVLIAIAMPRSMSHLPIVLADIFSGVCRRLSLSQPGLR